MTDEMAVPLLKVALLDAADEVRLLAYSMLDSKRKKLDRLIHKGLTKLKSSNLQPKSKKIIHQNLAEAFWELSYLGLVEGQSKQRALNSAKQQVLDALNIQKEDPWMHLLHARIAIRLGLYEEASNALKQSEKYAMDTRKLAPLYAEIAFETRHFNEIGHQLKQIDSMSQKNPILGGWVTQWS
jgi:predicted Zn-dependent protease